MVKICLVPTGGEKGEREKGGKVVKKRRGGLERRGKKALSSACCVCCVSVEFTLGNGFLQVAGESLCRCGGPRPRKSGSKHH